MSASVLMNGNIILSFLYIHNVHTHRIKDSNLQLSRTSVLTSVRNSDCSTIVNRIMLVSTLLLSFRPTYYDCVYSSCMSLTG